MTSYRYEFHSLVNEQVIAEIPLFGTKFDSAVSTVSSGTGSFKLDITGKRNSDLLEATIPGRTAVVVLRNDIPVWTGIVWSRTYQSQAKTVQMYFWEFGCYPSRQIIPASFTYTDKRINLFLQLWRDIQALPGRNLGINIPADLTVSGDDVTLDYVVTDRKYYSELMTALADVKYDGFDWTIDVARGSDGAYMKTLRVGYPYFGAVSSDSRVVFDYPGNILNYYGTESMAGSGTHFTMIGSGEGTDSPTYTVGYDDMLSYGWPRWDLLLTRKDITDPLDIQGLAEQEAFNRKAPMLVVKAQVKANVQPEFGSYALGDNCVLSINDPRFPDAGLLLPTRIVGWSLQPQTADESEVVSLTFAMELDESE